jgi:hypothetical protein
MARLTGAEAEALVAASCAVARPLALKPDRYETSLAALLAALGEKPSLPSLTLAIDLSVLMNGDRLEPLGPQTVPGPLKDAMRVYEDHVLARLVADRRWTAITEAVAAAPKDLRATAVGLLAGQLVSRLERTGEAKALNGPGVSQAVVRRMAQRPADDVIQSGRTALQESPGTVELMIQGFEALARAARRSKELLTDAEVFLLENVAALKGLGPRVTLAQLAEVAQQVEDRLPVRMKTSLSEGDAPTQLEEESAFPVGGFSSISTVGSLENLVTSELIYMDDPADPAAERPDQFDIRFVEGELLYYARDESVAVRRRRTLVLVFDASLDACRVQDEGERTQRMMFALGAGAAMVRRLATWLEAEAVSFDLVFTGANRRESPLKEEMGVMGLLLREWRERGQVELRESASLEEAVESARDLHRGRVQVVVFGGPNVSSEDADAVVVASDHGPAWGAVAEDRPKGAGRASDAWAQVAREILEMLLGARSALRRQEVSSAEPRPQGRAG